MPEGKKALKVRHLPMIPLRGLTVFPFMVLHFDVSRKRSIAALEEAMLGNRLVFLVTQKNLRIEEIESAEDVAMVGTVATVKQLLKLPNGHIRVLVEGNNRAKLSEIHELRGFLYGEVIEKYELEPESFDIESEALVRMLRQVFQRYIEFKPQMAEEILRSIQTTTDYHLLADMIAANIQIAPEEKQKILDCLDYKERLELLIAILEHEVELLRIEKKIAETVRSNMDKAQKEYYLREQMKVIQDELGDPNGISADADAFVAKAEEIGMPEDALAKVRKEAERLKKMTPNTPEIGVIQNYLEWMTTLPWTCETDKTVPLQRAKEILDEDHFGLIEVKERVLEFLAVQALSNGNHAPILCLAGPPGVGKTSVGKSIARAAGRKYVRISLGGVRDEADIRGHRRTYVGAMPGRMISALRQARVKNPLILLDEIDKIASDFRGDPAAALLEALDAEQNSQFVDHYIDTGFDLSKVLFVTTANRLDTIPPALLDRMEVIEISGYTDEEKLQIAEHYLLPKLMKQNGIRRGKVRVESEVVRLIIASYTREAGVRELERKLDALLRKAAYRLVSGERKNIKITPNNLVNYLGHEKYKQKSVSQKDKVGVASGLAWTSVGGVNLSIEVNVMPGSGKLELTGQLGSVMKESAQAAFSFIRSKADVLGLSPKFYQDMDIHIHIPEGATPKDGPSAGITMATAMISALTDNPVRRDVAMTGEITLRGHVLPIGGLKEKVLAAYRNGIHTVILPRDNRGDLSKVDPEITKEMHFVFASRMEEVLKAALCADFHKQALVRQIALDADNTGFSEEVPENTHYVSQ